MNPSWAVLIAAGAGLLAGLVAGVLAAGLRSRQDPAEVAPGRREAGLPAGSAEVLNVLRSASMVLDRNGVLVKTSPAAYAFGLVRGRDLMHPELRELAAEARSLGLVRERELELPRGPLGRGLLVVNARVAPLGDDLILMLVEDRTEARRVEEIRRDFVGNVSHELKTPVGALSLLAEAVHDAADDPDAVRHFANRMQRESKRLTSLVQEIIDLSRLQVADVLHEPEPVRIDDVVADAVDRCRLAAAARSVDMLVCGDEGAVVYGDRELLVTAVRNLVDNAVSYSPDETRVRVFVRRGVDGLVEIAVSDQGIGIAAADQDRIFERFYRVDPARSRATGGTGLGLSIVKHVAANHGGEVTLWSVPGQGSTFTLRLPESAPAEPRPARPADTAPPPCRTRRSSPNPGAVERSTSVTRILVVEDEESFSDPLSYLLRREGYEVAVADDGPAALDEFERNGADLVLLDLMLPGLPGTEVCRRLRTHSNVPVIMLTAKDGEIDKVVGLELGADDYVTKPYSSRELVARVRAVLRRGTEPEQSTSAATVEAGPVRMDVERHVVTVSGQPVAMPLKEFELLEILLRNAGRVLTRMQLIDRVWGSDYVGDTKTLDVHVKRLRGKIEPDPGSPQHLVTVRGLGYKFEP